MQLLLTQIGDHRYGLPETGIVELLRAVAITPLPKAPAIVEGVINVRGNLVSVLDIRARFRLPPKALDPADHFVVARAGPRKVALRVDAALDLVDVPEGDIDAAEPVSSGATLLAGIAKLPNGLVLIHNLEAFLSQAEAEALDCAMEAH